MELQALDKNTEASQSYLNSALQLLAAHEDFAIFNDTPSTMSRQCLTNRHVNTQHESPIVFATLPSPMESKALAFFSALLIGNDVLSSSIRKQAVQDPETYRKLLANQDLSLVISDIIGCPSWILSVIMDTTILDTWKRDQEKQGKLSIRELANRAGKIESMVEVRIKDLSVILGRQMTDTGLASPLVQDRDQIQHIQTYIFAHSVLIELHAIVSGPRAGVPEINESIDRTISVWKLFPHSMTLKYLAWPYCVSANLATGSQREYFRRMIAQRSSENRALGNEHDLISVMEECWTSLDRRGSDRDACDDWKDIWRKSKLSISFR
jgi:hypothetical protein